MYSCETCTTMFGYKTSLILRKNPNTFLNHSTRLLRNSYKFRCLLDQLVPKFAVLSSLSSVFTSGNVIALAATASSGSVHGAVTVAITDVAVTAVAIASGACLSTKVDFLWPKVEEQPGQSLTCYSRLKLFSVGRHHVFIIFNICVYVFMLQVRLFLMGLMLQNILFSVTQRYILGLFGVTNLTNFHLYMSC